MDIAVFNKDTEMQALLTEFGGKEFKEEDKEYILQNIDKNNIKRNLSILGGEPLCEQNIQGVINLCKEFKERYPEKIVYVWTGYVLEQFDEMQNRLLNYIDVLVDGKFEIENKDLSLKLRGSTNQRIINIK